MKPNVMIVSTTLVFLAITANNAYADNRCPMDGHQLHDVISTDVSGAISDTTPGVGQGLNLPELQTVDLEAAATIYVRLSVDGYTNEHLKVDDVTYFRAYVTLNQGNKVLETCSAVSMSRRPSSAHLVVAECSTRAEKKGPITVRARVHFNSGASSDPNMMENAKIEVCYK